jgi:hypothetical protein
MKIKGFSSIKSYIKSYYYSVKYNIRKWNSPYYDIKYGVGNLISYFKVIWNDRDWDYIFWLELNHKKLERMEKLIRENGCHLYAEKDADTIKKTRLAIKRIIDDEYVENVCKHHNEKWGDIDMTFEPVEDEEYSEYEKCVEIFFKRKNVITEEDNKQEEAEFRRLMDRSKYLKKQDLEYVTKMINKYLFNWWD